MFILVIPSPHTQPKKKIDGKPETYEQIFGETLEPKRYDEISKEDEAYLQTCFFFPQKFMYKTNVRKNWSLYFRSFKYFVCKGFIDTWLITVFFSVPYNTKAKVNVKLMVEHDAKRVLCLHEIVKI